MDLSNLQPRVIHSGKWLGRSKARSAASRIQDLNPHCEVDVHERMLTSDNALDLIRAYDLVCDGTDNFPSRYLINDACVLLGKPLIYGSVQRFDGQVTVSTARPPVPTTAICCRSRLRLVRSRPVRRRGSWVSCQV